MALKIRLGGKEYRVEKPNEVSFFKTGRKYGLCLYYDDYTAVFYKDDASKEHKEFGVFLEKIPKKLDVAEDTSIAGKVQDKFAPRLVNPIARVPVNHNKFTVLIDALNLDEDYTHVIYSLYKDRLEISVGVLAEDTFYEDAVVARGDLKWLGEVKPGEVDDDVIYDIRSYVRTFNFAKKYGKISAIVFANALGFTVGGFRTSSKKVKVVVVPMFRNAKVL
ncbi:hypothetical protein [Pyrococcus kukulkanii]|uniref:Uncharacterized protein n=1 Tax=Pyrococcus kukulkanii TaxID=1609559 RepID=A0ABV4T5T6_9EURY